MAPEERTTLNGSVSVPASGENLPAQVVHTIDCVYTSVAIMIYVGGTETLYGILTRLLRKNAFIHSNRSLCRA